ncbi:DNA-binding transcription factor [Lithospermum erythrorhizon]|uniref:DNA-binding transcription factor n=1 Tax=Lithospermum erythrorhizon TaxID=34254 RepID=A0AAV3REL8_LITER
MSLPLAKISFLVGAGIVTCGLVKESKFSDIFSGAFKIVLKQIRQDDSDSTPSTSKPRNDSLMQQVNSLRQELQYLASSRSVTIVSSRSSGSSKYGVVIIVVVVGYGYIWWKGWKLPDMMFATKRGLTDACASVAKQLEGVYSSIRTTKQQLSLKLDHVDSKIDECSQNTTATMEEVSELRGDVRFIGADVQMVHHVVKNLETKISRIEGRQNETNFGVGKLIAFVKSIEGGRTLEQIEVTPPGSSRQALELPSVSPSLRTTSLPSNVFRDPTSPSTSGGSNKLPLQSAVSSSGLKDIYGISEEVSGQSTPIAANRGSVSEAIENGNTGSKLHGRRFSGISASFLSSWQKS